MPNFKVYALRTETFCAIIEADSAREAEKLADKNYPDYDWSDCNESWRTEILFDETEKEEDE